MSILFFNDNTLLAYEKESQWDKCIDHLIKKAPYATGNRAVLLRLSAQCWYTLAFWDCYTSASGANRNIFLDTLATAYYFVQPIIESDADFSWLYGYFMCVNPYAFTFLQPDVGYIEKEGEMLIAKAHRLAPDNLFAAALYIADNGTKQEYAAIQKEVQKKAFEAFPSQSVIDEYFLGVFSRLKE